MAKPNLTEVYEALRVAEAEGRTDDVAKLIGYIESIQAAPDIAAEETFDPRELISSTIPAAGGAIAGAIVPKVIESGVDQVKAGRAAAARPPAASVTVQGAPSSALADIEEATTKGLSNEVTQQTRTAQRAARTEQMEKILAELKAKGIPVNPKILADMEAQYARPGSGILIPVERAREIAAQEAAATKAAPKGSLGQRAISQFTNPTVSADIGNFAKGVYDYKLPFVGSVGSLIGRGLVGAGAGMQGTDAYNRAKMGDTTGSVISGIGALGTAANLIPHPAAKAIGTGVGLSAEAINAYRDAMRKGQIQHGAPENYDNIDQMGNAYAQGGLVHLAGGGKPIPNPEDVQGMFSYAPGYYAEVADNIVPEGKSAGPNDAARHMLAAADLTRRIGNVPLVGKHIAGPVVKGLGYGHEIENYLRGKLGDRPQTQEDIEQDLYNNALGIQLGQNAGSFQDIVNKIPGAVNVKPYRKEAGKAYIRNPQEAGTPYKPFGAFAQGGLVYLAQGGQPPKPDADEGAAFIGYRPIQRQEKNRYGSGTGFLDALLGAPPSKENILDPRDLSYMKGYEKGEPYGIAATAVPFAGMAAKPLAKEIGTRAFMGETLTPKMMRQLMPEAQPAGIIKNEKGGNWMPGNIRPGEHWTPEDQLAETLGFHKNDPALENWVNTQLTRYVKNEMGSPDDSIRKLADQGILHFKPRSAYSAHNNQPTNLQREAEIKRTYADTPEGESALTQLGKDWETNVDAGIRSKTIGPKTIETYSEEFPWLKNAEGKKLQSIDDEFLYSHLGFDHMVDVLREQLGSGALRAESMKSLSVPQAVQRVHEYNLAREKAMQKVQLQAQSEMPVAKEYPEQGYKWLELKHPTDPSVTEKALKYEGDAMGHCVGGYCPDVEAGSTKIYSLRDAKGEPHVTIEVRPGNHHLGFEYPQGANSNAQFPKDFYYTDREGIRQSLPPQQHAEIYTRAKELFEQNPGSVMKNLQQAANEVLGAPPSTIKQIKGKQNAAVKDEYKPFVQDFVRSGKWEDVKDYQNAGLKNMDMTGSNYELTNVPEDIAKISHTERYHAVQEAVANKDLPKYATEEEVADAIRKYARKPE